MAVLSTGDSVLTIGGGGLTPEEKQKLDGIEAGAQVNTLEKIKVNGTEQEITDKTVDIQVPDSYEKSETYSKIELDNKLSDKVDKDGNKVLSTNDFTNEDKTKLDNIESGAEANIIEKIKVNGTEQEITDKTVDIQVPDSYEKSESDERYMQESKLENSEDHSSLIKKYDGKQFEAKYAERALTDKNGKSLQLTVEDDEVTEIGGRKINGVPDGSVDTSKMNLDDIIPLLQGIGIDISKAGNQMKISNSEHLGQLHVKIVGNIEHTSVNADQWYSLISKDFSTSGGNTLHVYYKEPTSYPAVIGQPVVANDPNFQQELKFSWDGDLQKALNLHVNISFSDLTGVSETDMAYWGDVNGARQFIGSLNQVIQIENGNHFEDAPIVKAKSGVSSIETSYTIDMYADYLYSSSTEKDNTNILVTSDNEEILIGDNADDTLEFTDSSSIKLLGIES